MKYMGSKRALLGNGLGKLIEEQGQRAARIVDPFCGAGFVAWYAAQRTQSPVIASDLQSYSVVLAKAVVARERPLASQALRESWLHRVKLALAQDPHYSRAKRLESMALDVPDLVRAARDMCAVPVDVGSIWGAYGGYYFSPSQAITLDYMVGLLPQAEGEREVCMAATIWAASKCAASPGHTAQPFRPTPSAAKYLQAAWQCDPCALAGAALDEICPKHANTAGEAYVADAAHLSCWVKCDDLVIVDPPYSGVHYSRFYHVLETLARGRCGPVSGAGRYPPAEERPQSDYSKKGTSVAALEALLVSLADVGATTIVTFPAEKCSNGLSGDLVLEIASAFFQVTELMVESRLSTLGGNNSHRMARKDTKELIILLAPR